MVISKALLEEYVIDIFYTPLVGAIMVYWKPACQ